MRINLYEWPLPEDELEAINMVFKLRPPPVFAFWRATVFLLLHDICTPLADQPTAEASPAVKLETHAGLKNYFHSDHTTLLVSLASASTSFKRTHYSSTKIPSDEVSVCVGNTLQLRLYAETQSYKVWAAGRTHPFTSCRLDHYCTISLPQQSLYEALSRAV